MSDEKPPEPPKASTDERKPPKVWFVELAPPAESKIDRALRMAEHNAAATTHGWLEHRHHAGKSIEISRSAYEAALIGANSGKGAKGLHAPAVSPHNGKGL